MYTLKDIASDNFRLLSEFDILNIDDVKSITIIVNYEKRKRVIINLELYDYLFLSNFKRMLKQKIRKDLGFGFDLKFGIGF